MPIGQNAVVDREPVFRLYMSASRALAEERREENPSESFPRSPCALTTPSLLWSSVDNLRGQEWLRTIARRIAAAHLRGA